MHYMAPPNIRPATEEVPGNQPAQSGRHSRINPAAEHRKP
jgi:hypothetical protein